MTPATPDEKTSGNQSIWYRIAVAEIILIVIPSLLLLYGIHTGGFVLPLPHLFMIFFTFMLIISGILILRGVINRFISILLAIKTADAKGTVSIDIKQDVTELREVRDALTSIMAKLDKTASELNRRSFELLALRELIDVAKKSLDIRSLQQLVLDKIMMVTGARIGSFLEYEAPGRQFRIVAVRGSHEQSMIDYHIPLEESLAKYAVLDKKSVLIKDIEADFRTCRVNNSKYGSPSFLSIPIVLENDVSAVVNLAGKLPDDHFDEDDEKISTIMLEEIDFALKNARLHFKVQELLKESEESNKRLQEEISRRMDSEEKLFHYQKNLEHLIDERTKELVAVNEKLKEEIAERYSAQEALMESEEKLRTIIDSAKDWIFIKDREDRYDLVNKSMASDLGLPQSAIRGKTSRDLFTEQEASLVEQRDQKIFTGEILEFEADLTFNGKLRVFYIIKVPVHDTLGNIVALCGIARDITERKKMEAHLLQAEKMEALGNLAGGVAHDLNNIIGVLVGYSELFIEQIEEENPLRNYATNILKSSERGAAIIQDLLTLARRGVSISEVVNLNRIIGDYFETLEFERLKTYHPYVTFNLDLDKDLLNVKGSPVHLGKTLMNLVSNAAESLSDGGEGEVTIRTWNCYLNRPLPNCDTVREGDYAVLEVSDNGKGISQEDLGKIFEPFYTKKVMGRSGTGLGLAVVWGAVQDHKAYIDVQSTEGKGSTFTLYFPITRDVPPQVKGEPPALTTYMGKGESILVVDDAIDQQELAMSILEKIGYRPATVSSGEEAVTYLKERTSDLVVLDMIMDPGMDGLETYQKILETNPVQKAIIVSGNAETDRVTMARGLGAGAYLRKPYTIEKLGLAIRRELDR